MEKAVAKDLLYRALVETITDKWGEAERKFEKLATAIREHQAAQGTESEAQANSRLWNALID